MSLQTLHSLQGNIRKDSSSLNVSIIFSTIGFTSNAVVSLHDTALHLR